jgi:hypothetical protein
MIPRQRIGRALLLIDSQGAWPRNSRQLLALADEVIE